MEKFQRFVSVEPFASTKKISTLWCCAQDLKNLPGDVFYSSRVLSAFSAAPGSALIWSLFSRISRSRSRR